MSVATLKSAIEAIDSEKATKKSEIDAAADEAAVNTILGAMKQ